MKLNVKAFALAGGIVWGINWFGLTWWMIINKGITHEKIAFISDTYIGFTVSPVGSLIALAWGFFDGFLLGLMIAWIYNKISPHFRSKDE